MNVLFFGIKKNKINIQIEPKITHLCVDSISLFSYYLLSFICPSAWECLKRWTVPKRNRLFTEPCCSGKKMDVEMAARSSDADSQWRCAFWITYKCLSTIEAIGASLAALTLAVKWLQKYTGEDEKNWFRSNVFAWYWFYLLVAISFLCALLGISLCAVVRLAQLSPFGTRFLLCLRSMLAINNKSVDIHRWNREKRRNRKMYRAKREWKHY